MVPLSVPVIEGVALTFKLDVANTLSFRENLPENEEDDELDWTDEDELDLEAEEEEETDEDDCEPEEELCEDEEDETKDDDDNPDELIVNT